MLKKTDAQLGWKVGTVEFIVDLRYATAAAEKLLYYYNIIQYDYYSSIVGILGNLIYPKTIIINYINHYYRFMYTYRRIL